VTFVPPPFKEPAFWSATMYDWKNNYTVENPINRYSLGSDDPLKMNADGTVTLYMQSTSPGKDKESNWLPTQKSGRWYILLRSYSPGRAAIESSFDPSVWAPGPVVQVQ
jgi:DNA sulfur modification protein DndE